MTDLQPSRDPADPPAASTAPTLARRARAAGVQLVILAVALPAVYYLLGWWVTPLMIGILVAAILLPLAFPYRYEDLVSAATWLGIAAAAWFYFGAQPLALIAGVIGLLSLVGAIADLSRRGV